MRQLAALDMLLNYTQLAVHRPDAAEFPELWTDQDVEIGYIARDGHVVFGVEDHDGLAVVTVWLADTPAENAGLVGLDVAEDGLVLTTPMGLDYRLHVPAGRYRLEFEHRFDGHERLHARLVFHPI